MYADCQKSLFTGGYRIYTSIDLDIQQELQQAIDDGLADFTVKVGSRLYGGCRCAKIERITKPDGPETEVVTIAAGTRQEEENE